MVKRARAGTISFYEIVFTRLLPIIFSAAAFILISPWTQNYRWIGNPTTVLYGWLLIFIGLFFVIEMFRSLGPAVGGKSTGASFGSVMFFLFAIASFISGGMITTGYYNFNDGNMNIYISVLFLLAIGMFMFLAREELFHGQRAHQALIARFG